MANKKVILLFLCACEMGPPITALPFTEGDIEGGDGAVASRGENELGSGRIKERSDRSCFVPFRGTV